MTWRSLFRKHPEPDIETEAEIPRRPGDPVSPQLRQVIARREGRVAPDPSSNHRLEGLQRQRHAILFDIEQGELAAAPDNPWSQRMSLLTEAMASVAADVTQTQVVQPGPFVALPATPITNIAISVDDPASVAFTIGDERFIYSEDPDWAERGHQIARADLVARGGNPAALMPTNTPPELRESLAAHLADTCFVFATDLRDRALDAEPLPESPTLDQLSQPCPVCGGWTDWRGTCQACARRNARLSALRREETRLLDERNEEAEDRHKLVEGIALARKRLRDVEAEIARLESATR